MSELMDYYFRSYGKQTKTDFVIIGHAFNTPSKKLLQKSKNDLLKVSIR